MKYVVYIGYDVGAQLASGYLTQYDIPSRDADQALRMPLAIALSEIIKFVGKPVIEIRIELADD